MKATHYRQPVYWGLLHGVNDAAAGYLLASYTLTHDYSSSFYWLSAYAILGFGGQVPVGFWLDKTRQLGLSVRLCFLLLPLVLLVSFLSPEAAIVLAGAASAFVHVTGGVICLQASGDRNGPVGLFTAPGVLGLTLGSLLGDTGFLLPLILLGGVALLGGLIAREPAPVYQPAEKKKGELDAHDGIMLLILLFMCFRSFLFDVVNYIGHQYEEGLLCLGLGAFAGKIIGGFVADKIGTRRFVYISLVSALLLFQFGKENLWMLTAGIACLQSSVPLTLLLLSRQLPGLPATATAFSLGLSVAFAGLPLYLVTDKAVFREAFSRPYLVLPFFATLLLLAALGPARRFFRSRMVPQKA